MEIILNKKKKIECHDGMSIQMLLKYDHKK